MSEAARRPRYTLAEYVILERMSNVRHEYLDGQILARAGGTPEHGRICANVTAILSNRLEGRPCSVFTSDVRVRVLATGLDTYPDVTVVCGQAETDDLDPHALVNPVLLVEVASPSTEAYDRGEKLEHYKGIPSLREVVLVAYAERRVEVWRRQDDGAWMAESFGPGGSAHLTSLACELSLDSIYRDPLRGD